MYTVYLNEIKEIVEFLPFGARGLKPGVLN